MVGNQNNIGQIRSSNNFMKLSDVFAKYIKSIGVKAVFGLQGGAVVHFFDSLEKNKINVTYTHHEESAALAAVSNAKATNNIGCAVFTTGPGSTNALTGLAAAWQDSVPVIFISGQARSNHTSYGKKVRQVGTQEINICDIVRPITKYTKFIKNKNNFVKELVKAKNIAISGRPGPVWLDIPLDLHWVDISPNFKLSKNKTKTSLKKNLNKYKKIKPLLKKSQRPIIIMGYGAKNKSNINILSKISKKMNIPFVLTWNSADFFETIHPYNIGIIGMSGQRGANKAIFKSDLLICVGTHLSIPHTSTLYNQYAPEAKKIIINIDKNQLQNLNVKFDLKINDNANNFFQWIKNEKKKYHFKWLNLDALKKKNWYNIKDKNYPNSNLMIRELTKKINKKTCIVVDGGGTALYSAFQSSVINKDTKLICSSAISSMGTGLAETIGVAQSEIFKEFYCIIGDGSFLMNVQDLQTISQNNINVKILLINNNGYLAIRNTQREFLQGRYFGTCKQGGLTFPKFKNVAKTFSIKYLAIKKSSKMKNTLEKIRKTKGPLICEIFTSSNQAPLFKQGYKKMHSNKYEPQPLSEMYPFIDKSSKPISNTNN
jgi:acetolactate synthase I/II/III large subunit